MSHDDLDFIASMLADVEVMRYWPRPLDRDEAIVWIDRQLNRYRHDGVGHWLISDRQTGEPLGQAGPAVKVIDGLLEVEVGYLVARGHWRKGIATEAVKGVLDYLFTRNINNRVLALIRPENIPSQGVARKVGMVVQPFRIVEQAGFEHWVYKIDCPRVDFNK
jgi:RimJ/RimL family protein N-acetyltransferase